MRSLSIAQVCSSRSWGGMEMHVVLLAEQLQNLGHQVTVWCAPAGELESAARSKNMPTFSFEPGYVNPLALMQTTRFLHKKPVDILHAHYGKDLWTLVPANEMSGKIPVLFTKHIGTQKPKQDVFHRYLYRHVRFLIAISRVIAKNLLDTHPVIPEQIITIHHGVELALYSDSGFLREKIRQEWSIKPDEFLVGTIGRLQEGKGHLEFLDMAAAIGKEFPQARFVIIGEPTRGEEHRAEAIYEKIRLLHLEKRVLMPGFRNDISAVLAAMDLFAFPSRAEAFGLVLIEAMAAGKPVISTRCDGVLDIVEHEVNGLLFAPGNPAEFSASVKKLIEQPVFRNLLAANGRKTIAQKFSRERSLSQLSALYEKSLAKR